MFSRRHALTPAGVARVFGRGILANFAPGNQAQEIENLAELFRDLAMSRDADHEISRDRFAASDADWLTAMADELESFLTDAQRAV
jgi:hypothetical protein